MMASILLKTLLFAFLLVVVNAGTRINSKDCHHVKGWEGEIVYCPVGYVATGLCASGRKADCDKAYTNLKCCRVIGGRLAVGSRLQDFSGKYGRWLSCPKDSIVKSVCTSGGGGMCGHRKWTRIGCWNNSGLKLSGHCDWIYGYHGVMKTCAPNQVMAGACTSGKRHDCNHHGQTVRCCHIHS